MFKVELEAGDLGEYQSCGVQGLGEESGHCFQLGLFHLTHLAQWFVPLSPPDWCVPACHSTGSGSLWPGTPTLEMLKAEQCGYTMGITNPVPTEGSVFPKSCSMTTSLRGKWEHSLRMDSSNRASPLPLPKVMPAQITGQ